ncbi:MAG: helix-turn-helix domain-containing protein [Bacillus sp. (in: Bacteria)]|nr:helix-turn-helix domain-containing protein [Bacillus sp. (in: firmicutes)]
MTTIAEQLQETMTTRGITRSELAEMTGISEETLLTIETNASEATVSQLEKLSSSLNISFYIGDCSI